LKPGIKRSLPFKAYKDRYETTCLPKNPNK
jgi:hypothetical protein